MSDSNAWFRFTCGTPYKEKPAFNITETPRASGGRWRRKEQDRSRFVMSIGTVTFPANPSGLTYADLKAFFEARSGPVDTFLFPPKYPENLIQVDTFIATAGQTVFPLSRKYVLVPVDAAPNSNPVDLTVTKNGVPQGSPTLANNYTAPTITIGACSLNDVVVITYKVGHRVQFDVEDLDTDLIVPGGTLAVPGSKKIVIALSEEVPGNSYV